MFNAKYTQFFDNLPSRVGMETACWLLLQEYPEIGTMTNALEIARHWVKKTKAKLKGADA